MVTSKETRTNVLYRSGSWLTIGGLRSITERLYALPWKEGRGTAEAHQRGGKLLAVEYVGQFQDGSDAHTFTPFE
jgi:hypothetical protein